MLGLSQTCLSQEILRLGFLYVNNSFPWTAPSSSGAQARSHAEPTCSSSELPPSLPPSAAGAGCCNRTPCHWRRAESLRCFSAEPQVKHLPPPPMGWGCALQASLPSTFLFQL